MGHQSTSNRKSSPNNSRLCRYIFRGNNTHNLTNWQCNHSYFRQQKWQNILDIRKYAILSLQSSLYFGLLHDWVCIRSGSFAGSWENSVNLGPFNFECFFFSTSIEAPRIVPMFPAYYIFNGLLILLLVLHIFWTYLILKIAYKALNAGQMEGDIRSSSSNYSEDSKSQ